MVTNTQCFFHGHLIYVGLAPINISLNDTLKPKGDGQTTHAYARLTQSTADHDYWGEPERAPH